MPSSIQGQLGVALTRLLENSHRKKDAGTILADKGVQLPLWPEPMRGTPNPWLRGALFAAIQGKERRALKRELLATVTGLQIRFTGWQLDQSDMDVWDTFVHLSRMQKLGQRVEFSAHALLVALGRNTGKSDHEWLKSCVARLYSAGVEITIDRHSYFGTMLKGERDEMTGRYAVELDPKLLAMYSAGWTRIDWTERQALRRKPLALWLHGWYSSHAKPYPLRVATVQRLSGCRNTQSASFRRQLAKALDELVKIGAIESWAFRDDLVDVVRRPTQAQRKHLTKAAVAKTKHGARDTMHIGAEYSAPRHGIRCI